MRRLCLIASLGVIVVFWPRVIAFAESITVSLSVGQTFFSASGYTSPDATVTLKENGAVIATTTADSAGAFTLSVLDDDGIHSYEIYAIDQDGRLTPTITETVSLSAGSTTEVSNIVLPPTIETSTTTIGRGNDILLTGYGAPNSDIVIFFANSLMATVQTDTSGRYNGLISTGQYSEGTHNLYTRNVYSGGHTSLNSFAISITLTVKSTDAQPATDESTTKTPVQDSPTSSPSPSPFPVLPWWLAIFDTNGDQHLSTAELKSILTSWITSWTKTKEGTCDLNNDGICDLYDLSILLYYIGR